MSRQFSESCMIPKFIQLLNEIFDYLPVRDGLFERHSKMTTIPNIAAFGGEGVLAHPFGFSQSALLYGISAVNWNPAS